jgi:hypothetical protein
VSTYFTNFSEYTAGAQPPDWTKRWYAAAGYSWLVTTNAGFGGTKNGLVVATTVGAKNAALSWDDLDSDGLRADVEIVARWKSSNGTSQQDMRTIARASGGEGSETGYRMGFINSAPSLRVYSAGTQTTLATGTNNNQAAGTWYWTRSRISGSTVQTRTWVDGGTEPGTWTTVTDTSVTAAGWVGINQSSPVGVTTWDLVGIGTGGDAAPTVPPPVSVAVGADLARLAGTATSITATAFSSGGSISTYAWTKESGPSVSLSGASTATLSFTPSNVGWYVFRCTVTDSIGQTGYDEVTVAVYGTAEARPFAVVSAGLWTAVGGANIAAVLADESTSTYGESADNPDNSATVLLMEPQRSGARTVNYDLTATASTPAASCLVEYLQGATVIASWTEALTTSTLNRARALTTTQNAAMDSSVLIPCYLRFTGDVA